MVQCVLQVSTWRQMQKQGTATSTRSIAATHVASSVGWHTAFACGVQGSGLDRRERCSTNVGEVNITHKRRPPRSTLSWGRGAPSFGEHQKALRQKIIHYPALRRRS